MVNKPKPFSRPTISLSEFETGVRKSWQDIAVERLSPTDNVLGCGILKVITRMGDSVVLDFASGERVYHKVGDTVHAFTSGTAQL